MRRETLFDVFEAPAGPRDRQALCAETDEWVPGSLAEQADVIAATHHAFLRRELPRLGMLVRQVHDRYGLENSVLGSLGEAFHELHQELIEHLDAEARVVFPRIRRLEAEGRPAGVAVAVRVAECGHVAIGEALRRLERWIVNPGLPAERCGTCRSLLDGLDELTSALRRVLQLENNLLYPRAVTAEAMVLDLAGD